ncbi:MAG TPA: nitrite reductase small subunit NirD [Steroidobacteraceae bacterium]|nr:nitrite reductase small subunit NirD [Steroidobacteraceae bacterium]
MTDNWNFVCTLDDIIPFSGVAALIGGKQIAIFRVGDEVYAVDNLDPESGANVLARGLIGDLKGELVVASPIYKHHFSLTTGTCIEAPESSIQAYPAKIEDSRVWVRTTPQTVQVVAPVRARRRLVVIGNGMAAMRTVEELLDHAPDAYDITVFGAEPHGNYNRIMLSPVLAGEKKFEEIILHPKSWYAERGITLHSGDSIVKIDRRKRVVKSAAGVEAGYDRLLLATGSNPVMLPLPGKGLPGVVTFRDLQDVNSMLKAARQYHRAVVIGGGLLGLEAAHGLLKQGMDVTVVHLLDTLMERQLDKPAAQLLRASLEKRGLKFHMPAQTAEILGDTRVTGVRFANGTEIAADIVVMAVGIRPNTELAQSAGLRCERGVLVNDTLQTFDPSIYAVGECVQHRNHTYGLIAPLWEQARVCATHLAELGVSRYRGSLTSTQLKVTGIDLFSAGDFVGGPGTESLVMRDARRGVYKRLIIQDNKVRGAVLYGDVKDGPWYLELMSQERDIGALRDKLLFGAAYAASVSSTQ